MATKILITDGMADDGVKILKGQSEFDVDLRKGVSSDDLADLIGNYECIVIRSATTLTQQLIEKASNMKLIVRAGAGVDNIHVPTATEKKIPVMNTATANSLAAAEQTVALMFSMLRKIPQAAASLSAGKWDRASFKGYEVTGKVLGLVGLGHIGRIVGEKAVGLGMKVVAFDPMIKSLGQISGPLAKMDESVTLASTVEELAGKADILTVHVPKIPQTQNLINEQIISKMKDGSFVINCARGGIVNEADVLNGIESGKLKGAAFDVFEKEPPDTSNPLFKHPDVVCVPHLGASTFEAQKRVALTAAEQIVGFFTNNDKTGIINNV